MPLESVTFVLVRKEKGHTGKGRERQAETEGCVSDTGMPLGARKGEGVSCLVSQRACAPADVLPADPRPPDREAVPAAG